ncbi:MAG: bacteriohemerythrin [Janthinobacterium lividum]
MSANTKELFTWSDRFLVGHEAMDATHREFVELVGAMLAAPDAELARLLDDFAGHAERHFEDERQSMLATGFPAAECHIDEHTAVLASVHEVRVLLAGGGHEATCRALARELSRWFPAHADYMDASLAQWLVKKRLGGTPVVLRRSPTESAATEQA